MDDARKLQPVEERRQQPPPHLSWFAACLTVALMCRPIQIPRWVSVSVQSYSVALCSHLATEYHFVSQPPVLDRHFLAQSTDLDEYRQEQAEEAKE